MTAPFVGLIADSSVGPVTDADIQALTDLMNRVSTVAIGEPDTSVDEVRDDLIGPRFDVTQDTVLITMGDGRAVLYAQAYDEHDERAYVDVFVDPSFADDVFAQLADRAVDASLHRLRQLLLARDAVGTTVGAGLYQGEARLLNAYKRAGFTVDTVYWRMRRDLDGPIEVVVPADVEIRAVNPDDDEVMGEALRLRNLTFQDHHGHVDLGFDDYAEVWRTAAKYDTDAWWFAYYKGETIGLCLGDNGKADDDAGFIRTLGVAPFARGRGIAKALLLNSFEEYRRRGRVAVQLGVDSSNETGATRLYESVGMVTILVIDSLVLKLTTED